MVGKSINNKFLFCEEKCWIWKRKSESTPESNNLN